MQFRPDARTMNGMETYEQEQMKRLNPYGPARPPWPSPESLTLRQRMRLLWRRLLTFGRKPGDDTQGD